MYMGFTAAGGPTSSTSAGTIDNKTGHREVSLAAKFYFCGPIISRDIASWAAETTQSFPLPEFRVTYDPRYAKATPFRPPASFGELTITHPVPAQDYAIGADVSFLAKCEQDGIVFKENGKPIDVLGSKAARKLPITTGPALCLFVDPAVSQDKLPNDLPYTLALAKRAKTLGFKFLLDLHYADSWADPGKQPTPAAWSKLKHKQLVEQVLNYTRDAITTFAAQGVMPDMVQVGNEVTNGMLWPDGKLPDNWDNFTDLLKAGIAGVEAGRGAAPRPRIMIHIERSGNYDAAVWFFDNLIAHQVFHSTHRALRNYPIWQRQHRANLRRQNLHRF